MLTRPDAGTACVDLYWLPLGAGAHCVRWNGRVYEALVAARAHRERCDLYHAALEVRLDDDRFVIEMAPVWDRHEPDRGVVAEGAVGYPWLGRSRWFRYEVRRWRDGFIPDVAAAVDSPRRLSRDHDSAQQILELIPSFPAVTWGRDELGTGEMWNSNSLVAWLLARSGHNMEAARPPTHGRAPGWAAGLAVAARQVPRLGGADRPADPRSDDQPRLERGHGRPPRPRPRATTRSGNPVSGWLRRPRALRSHRRRALAR